MNKSTSSSTRICASCGLEKPLAAFTLRAGLLGMTYSNICSDCRQGKSTKEHGGETRRDVGGSRLRSGERVKAESDKKELVKQLKEEAEKQQEKGTKAWLEKALKQETSVTDEKRRRAEAEEKKVKPTEQPAPDSKTEQERRFEQEREVRISGTINLGEAKYSQSPLFDTLKRRLGKEIGKQSEQPLTDAIKRTWKPK